MCLISSPIACMPKMTITIYESLIYYLCQLPSLSHLAHIINIWHLQHSPALATVRILHIAQHMLDQNQLTLLHSCYLPVEVLVQALISINVFIFPRVYTWLETIYLPKYTTLFPIPNCLAVLRLSRYQTILPII